MERGFEKSEKKYTRESFGSKKTIDNKKSKGINTYDDLFNSPDDDGMKTYDDLRNKPDEGMKTYDDLRNRSGDGIRTYDDLFQESEMKDQEQLKKVRSNLNKLSNLEEKTGSQLEKERLFKISKENLKKLKSDFIKSAIEKGMFFSEAESLEAIEQEKKIIEGNMTLTINLSSESVNRFLKKGKQEVFWDHLEETGIENMKGSPTSQNKDFHSEYISYRETAENALKKFVPEKFQDKKPVYAALAGGTSKDLERGACPGYGNLFFELDNSQLEKSILNFNDSLKNVEENENGIKYFSESSLLSMDDAEEVKSIINIAKKYNGDSSSGLILKEDYAKRIKIDAGYIEASVFDEITPEKIKSVCVYLAEKNDLEGVGHLVDEFPQFKNKFKFFIANAEVIGELSASWLEKNFEGNVDFTEKMESSNNLWKEIGLDSGAQYSEIKNALDDKCNELWEKIRHRLLDSWGGVIAHPGNIGIVRKNIGKLVNSPEAMQKAELYLKLEKERLFFG